MNIRLFNKTYWVRRFDEQKVVKGYITSGYSDFQASLHIHPLSTDQQQALPEGERMIKRLEGHGEIKLLVANQDLNRKADLLYYHGDWYECVSCQLYDHTVLWHYNYQFTPVPRDAARSPDIEKAPGEGQTGGDEPGTGTPGEGETGGGVQETTTPPIASEDRVGFVIVEPGSGLKVDAEGNLSLDRTGGDSNAGD